MPRPTGALITFASLWLAFSVLPRVFADDDQLVTKIAQDQARQVLPTLNGDWEKLSKTDACWVNRKAHQVAVDGVVSLTRGYLEMFACKVNSKEHESVVALKSQAAVIHTALLLAGAKNGRPARFRPTYQPATGTTIEILVEWIGEDGQRKKAKAQSWVRDLKTKQAMQHDWVFAGSGFWKDPDTGKSYYRAEGGELICVSNFPTAMLDLPIESTQANDALNFEALTENIPPRDTPVRVYLVPKLEKAKLTKPEATSRQGPSVEQ